MRPPPFSVPKRPLLLSSLTLITALLVLGYVFLISQQRLQKQIFWLDAAMEIKLEIAMGRLWLIEATAGGNQESLRSLQDHLQQAESYTLSILDGGNQVNSVYDALDDDSIRRQVNQLFYQLHQFRIELAQHHENMDKPAALPARYDLLFESVMNNSVQLEQQLKRHIHNQGRTQNAIMLALLTIILLLLLLSIYLLWEFNRRRSHFIRKLTKANRRISEQNSRLQALAHSDQLTGLANRKMLETLAHQALSRVRRKQSYMALCFIDLDHFKPINDQHGHHTGDQVLISFANCLKMLLREGDLPIRLAGDEFIILLEASSSAELRASVENIAGRIQQRLTQPIVTNPEPLYLKCSIGTAIAPDHASELAQLLHYADLAMYESKKLGRGRHCFYSGELNLKVDCD